MKKCALCNGDHTSTSIVCPKHPVNLKKQAQEAARKRQTEKQTKQKERQAQKQSTPARSSENSQRRHNPKPGTYAAALVPAQPAQRAKPKTSDTATQTSNSEERPRPAIVAEQDGDSEEQKAQAEAVEFVKGIVTVLLGLKTPGYKSLRAILSNTSQVGARAEIVELLKAGVENIPGRGGFHGRRKDTAELQSDEQ